MILLLYLNFLFQLPIITKTCTSHTSQVRDKKFALTQRPKQAGQIMKASFYIHGHLPR